MSERGGARTSGRENNCRRSSLCFTFAIGAHSISEEVARLSFMVSPRKTLCLLSLVIIVVHVILSNKILDHID